ncbi:hypothetical protein DL98DRAFT_539514 [Cadophora sp. DSE1049]|nr:hypothetical protein DL98DRAFT_539514 [Cadophora sp. DSE1049]
MSPQCQSTMEGGDDIQGTQALHGRSRESTPSDIATTLAPEPASIRAPYQGEDSRVTLLRTRASSLESEYDQLKVKHSALEKKEIEWERTVACLDKSNSNLREQLDAVEHGSYHHHQPHMRPILHITPTINPTLVILH